MSDTLKPTGILLVGTIFICLSLTLNAAGSISDLPDLQKEMKRSLSGNLDQSQGSAMGKLRVHGDTITFPWSERHKPRSAPQPPVPVTAPSRERIALNESNPHRALSDLTAINSRREREVVWEGSQEGDRESGGLSNSLAISVTGHIVAGQQQRMFALLQEGRLPEAAAIHRRLVALTDACFLNGSPSTIRYVLRQLGFAIGEPRLPVVEPGETMGARIMAEVIKHELDVPVTA